jgi:hypothetical protein
VFRLTGFFRIVVAKLRKYFEQTKKYIRYPYQWASFKTKGGFFQGVKLLLSNLKNTPYQYADLSRQYGKYGSRQA